MGVIKLAFTDPFPLKTSFSLGEMKSFGLALGQRVFQAVKASIAGLLSGTMRPFPPFVFAFPTWNSAWVKST